MDTEKGSSEAATNDSSNDINAREIWQDNEEITECSLGKAVAQRAVYRSRQRRTRHRRVRNIDNRRLPSRLSKVSIADEHEN